MTSGDVIKFLCPHCGQKISASFSAINTNAICPTCGQGFQVSPSLVVAESNTPVTLASTGLLLGKSASNKPRFRWWAWAIVAIVGILESVFSLVVLYPALAQRNPNEFWTLWAPVVHPIFAALLVGYAIAPRHVLENPKLTHWIGASDPLVARIACIIAAIVFCVIIPALMMWFFPV